MKREHYEEWFSGLDDRTIEEIAADIPALDEAARDQIEALCEEKMRMKDMKTGHEDMVCADNIQNITKTQWFRPVMTAAACLVIAAGIAGGAMLGGRMPSTAPLPSVNSRNDDPTAATAESEETTEGKSSIITETVAAEGSTAASSETSTSAQTETSAASTEEETSALPEGLSMELIRALFDKNLQCLDYFVLNPLDISETPLDGEYIYEVTSSEFASYAEFERFIYSTYSEYWANDLLTNFPMNGAMYLEYDGKFCMDTYYAIGGLDYQIDWSDYEIVNPAVYDEDRVVFDVKARTNGYGDAPVEEVIYDSCWVVREAGVWKMEYFCGFDKPVDTRCGFDKPVDTRPPKIP